MFTETTSTIDEDVQVIASDLEKREIGMRVVAGRTYAIPHFLFEITVRVQKPRRFNILEEFILKAAHDLRPGPKLEELSELLGMDSLFIEAVYKQLQTLNAIAESEDKRLALTKSGMMFYEQGEVPQPPEVHRGNLVFSPFTTSWAFVLHKNSFSQKNSAPFRFIDPESFQRLQASAEQRLTARDDYCQKMVADASTAAGLDWNNTKQGQKIVAIDEVSTAQTVFTSSAMLILQDTLAADNEDNVSFRFYDLRTGKSQPDLDAYLSTVLNDNKMPLSKLIEEEFKHLSAPVLSLGEEKVVETEYQKAAKEVYKQQAREQRDGTKESSSSTSLFGTVKLLRDADIRPQFLNTLGKAKHTVLIISPWMSEQVVDDEFRQLLSTLAKRNVTTVIGWGIALSEGAEERRPSNELLTALKSIVRADGEPGVIAWWVGNQHSKDVLVDQSVHLSGSHNWLSYRGDRYFRGESTYYITVPEPVHVALNYIEPMLAKCAKQNWRNALRMPRLDADILSRCCVTWVTVRQPEDAFYALTQLTQQRNVTSFLILRLLTTICASLCHYPLETLKTQKVVDLLQAEAIPIMAVTTDEAHAADSARFVGVFKTLLAACYRDDPAATTALVESTAPLLLEVGVLPSDQTTSQFLKTLTPSQTVKQKQKKKK